MVHCVDTSHDIRSVVLRESY